MNVRTTAFILAHVITVCMGVMALVQTLPTVL